MITFNANLQSLLNDKAHRYATLWLIERRDGVKLRFTDHDVGLLFDDGVNGEQLFVPAGGFNASARQKQDGLRSRNLETRGIVDDASIKHDDLRAGRYREAKVTEFLVDWRYPWAGVFLKNVYYVEETEYSKGLWVAQLEGLSRFVRPDVGEVYGRLCRYTLFDTRCTVVEALHTDNGTVSTVVTQRMVVTTNLFLKADGWYEDGLLRWTTGANAGLETEIRVHLQASGRLEFHLATPYDILIGDAFTITAGCDKTLATCRDKFNNLANHGGFPTIPGTDQYFQTPH